MCSKSASVLNCETNTQGSIRIAEEIIPKRADCIGFGLKTLLSACLRDPSSACTLTYRQGEALNQALFLILLLHLFCG